MVMMFMGAVVLVIDGIWYYSCCTNSMEQGFLVPYQTLIVVKLLKQHDWLEWQDLEYLQLNQYYNQSMFGVPQMVNENVVVFRTV